MFSKNTLLAGMDARVRIGMVGPEQQDLLIEMYDQYEPLGMALGLPPRTAAARREWILSALDQKVNVAAFSPAGEVVGHCFLAADEPHSAELAIFIRQEFRRRGIGSALVIAALELGGAAGLRRVWTMTPSGNRPALQLQKNCGFRVMKSVYPADELEIDLPLRRAALEMR